MSLSFSQMRPRTWPSLRRVAVARSSLPSPQVTGSPGSATLGRLQKGVQAWGRSVSVTTVDCGQVSSARHATQSAERPSVPA
jgi:hypothetical protein